MTSCLAEKTLRFPTFNPAASSSTSTRFSTSGNYLYDEYWVLSRSLYTREGHFSIYPYASSYESFPLYFRQFGLSAKAVPERQSDGTYRLTVHDIPGIEDEPYMPPLKTIEARVEFYHLEEGSPQNETPDHFWTRTGKKWNDDLEHFINKKSVLDQEVFRITSPSDSPEVKLRKVYARVQQIRDLSMEVAKSEKEAKQENIKKNSNVEDMLHHGYGNGREINFLFVGLARSAGLESAEVFVAPRGNNFFYPQLQDTSELRADIVWARAGDKDYYLDPASVYFPFGILRGTGQDQMAYGWVRSQMTLLPCLPLPAPMLPRCVMQTSPLMRMVWPPESLVWISPVRKPPCGGNHCISRTTRAARNPWKMKSRLYCPLGRLSKSQKLTIGTRRTSPYTSRETWKLPALAARLAGGS